MLHASVGIAAEKLHVRVGIYQNPPKLFIDDSGEPVGFFPDVVEAIAEENDWELEWVDRSWTELLRDLESGNLDLMLDVAHTPERAERYQFNETIVLSNWSTLFNGDSASPIFSLHDLEGQRLSILAESVQYDELRRNLNALQIPVVFVLKSNYEEVLRAVVDKEADVAVVNRLVGRWYQHQFPDLRANTYIFQPTALHVTASDAMADRLLPDFDATLQRMKVDPDSAYATALSEWITDHESVYAKLWGRFAPWILGSTFLCLILVILFRWRLFQRTRELREKVLHAEELNHALVQNEAAMKRYGYIMEQIPHFIWTSNAEGKIVFCNKYSTEFTGLTLEQVQQNGWESTVHPEDLPNTLTKFNEAMTEKGNLLVEHRVFNAKEESWHWFLVQATPLLGKDGEIIEWIGFATNINQLRAYQDELIHARDLADEGNRAKSDFLAVMNHELRTPLNAIVGPAELLLDEAEGESRELLELIQHSGTHLQSLINNILDLSRIESGKDVLNLKEADLAQRVVRDLAPLKHLAERKDLAFKMIVDPQFPRSLKVDAQKVFQILNNLAGNAVKFTDRGQIVVSLSFLTRESGAEGTVRISVSDTGPGIPDGFRTKIFEPFQQVDMSSGRDFGGTGLGLAIAQRLAHLMDGGLVLQESSSAGSIFELSFPAVAVLTEQNSQRPAPSSNNTSSDYKNTQILLVEDDPGNIKVFGMIMKRFGFSYDTAETGENAVRLATENQYDLIFMDIWLPGMDGIEAARLIREHKHECDNKPVIVALTAHAMEENKEACFAAGMDHFLSKPINVKHLKDILMESASSN